MAAQDILPPGGALTPARLGLSRCALTGAVVVGALFALCWIGVAAGLASPSHMFISLFTVAPIASAAALGIGLCWSLVFGALSGALIAVVYNASSFLGRP
ncbi:hypothetical protein [Phenylobacterium sp.]|uniref:hypothetical protein n=1 Tax=Phenylobacterium sp. TaxID=1871053 RepID=UPI003567E64F